jgi:hypothetical protein
MHLIKKNNDYIGLFDKYILVDVGIYNKNIDILKITIIVERQL